MTPHSTPLAKNAVIIVAAGKGLRAGGALAKQWQDLSGVMVAQRTVDTFQANPLVGPIVMVLHAGEMDRRFDGVRNVQGGENRADSVRAGLRALEGLDIDNVLIHDVARPLVSPQTIKDVIDALSTHKGAAPALTVTDALWRGVDGFVSGTQDRDGLYRAQTPQGFHFDTILKAHIQHSGDAADDVAVARAAGVEVAIVPGDPNNLKLTWAADFTRAQAILRGTMDIRLGNGYDVHKFGPGDHVILCGVRIPHDAAMVGHSDADVAMHAVTDAIYGALAEGDIGRHFPPSDPQWKGADSATFLKHAVDLAQVHGFKIGNIDVTIVCEMPKIGPHASAMIARMSDIMGLDAGRVSVKATTSERLGFTGRGEGIAALATATVVTL